jgi:DNA repair protein RadC
VNLRKNHPSGSTEPSPEDIEVTEKLARAGEILGIKLLDHVIVTRNGYYSFKDQRLM